MTKYLYFLLMVAIFLFTGCTSGQKIESKQEVDIEGSWVRFGDEHEGITVKIQKSGNLYSARMIQIPDKLKEFASPGDIFWENIKRISTTQWQGTVISKTLIKNVTTGQIDRVINKLEARFILINDNLLEVNISDIKQRWKRAVSR